LFSKIMQYADALRQQALFSGDSGQRHITVIERDGVRLMLFGSADGERETAYNPLDPDASVFEYPRLMATALALQPDTQDLLLIGLGGGYLPRMLQKHRPDIRVTVVEIDPLVIRLAEDFFDFRPGGSVTVALGDGRAFLENAAGRYDQIWVDAYDGTYIPAPLTTVEFLALCRKRLQRKGVLAQNVHAAHPLYMAHQATFTEIFGYCYVLRGAQCGNAVFVAQLDRERPTSVSSAFAAGLRRHGVRFGSINLITELRKAAITSYADPCAVLRSACGSA